MVRVSGVPPTDQVDKRPAPAPPPRCDADPVDLETLRALTTPEGTAALAAALRLDLGDPLRAASELRRTRAGLPPRLASAALEQVTLRQAARAKLAEDADQMFFTRDGLEQATRQVVARRRAHRLASAGVTRMADLGCGLGVDTIAFARAGIRVRAFDVDPLTAAIADANVAMLGVHDHVEVVCGDAATVELEDYDGAFCDPARRDTGRRDPNQRDRAERPDDARTDPVRHFDPQRFSPPWSYVQELMSRIPSTVVKLGPGLDHSLIPVDAEAEWVSVSGNLVEAALWCGPLRRVARRASVLRGGASHELTGSGTRNAAVVGVRGFLYQPDPAVVRAHLVAEFADAVEGGLGDPHIAYVFADAPVATPFGRCLEVVETLPYPLKRLRVALRQHDIGRLEILVRGLAVDPNRLRPELRLTGSASASLVLARLGDAPTALLCQPVDSGPA
jgi:hypothetical protein